MSPRATLLTLSLLLGAVPAVHAEALPGCSLEPTGETLTVLVGARTYNVYAPASLAALEPGTPVPLLLSMHGLAGSANNHGPKSGWTEFSESHPMVVVFPDGGRKWDNREDSADVAYLREVIADVSTTYCIDDTRVHATGHSNGAFMAQRLACDAYDLVASIAPYAGGRPDNGLQGGPCSPKRAVPVAMFHGDADGTVKLSQGMASRDGWVTRHDCDTLAMVEDTDDGSVEINVNCTDEAEVRFHVYPGQPHAWPEGERRSDMLTRMWAFLERFPHPAPWDEGTSLPSNEPTMSQDEDQKAITRISMLSPQPEDIDVGASDSTLACEPGKRKKPKKRKLAPAVANEVTFDFLFEADANTIGASDTPVPGCEVGGPLAERLVTISFGDGLPAHTITDANGRASVTLTAPATPGSAVIRASFDGDDLTQVCPARARHFKLTVFATP